jgi:hypothetical protein
MDDFYKQKYYSKELNQPRRVEHMYDTSDIQLQVTMMGDPIAKLVEQERILELMKPNEEMFNIDWNNVMPFRNKGKRVFVDPKNFKNNFPTYFDAQDTWNSLQRTFQRAPNIINQYVTEPRHL